jgi:acyl-CoA thioesterase I
MLHQPRKLLARTACRPTLAYLMACYPFGGRQRRARADEGDRMKRYGFITLLGGAALLALATFMCANITAAAAAPLRIVAIGASNTHGFYVGNEGAYPAKLQALLRAKGIDAQVTNAGVPLETTGMMLRRIDKDVPDGTDIVILEPGGNDKRFLVPPQWRAANIAEMERRLQARSIQVIVYDEFIPLRYRTLDFIHLTHEGHAMIAAALLPRVMEILDRRRNDVPARRNASRPAPAR